MASGRGGMGSGGTSADAKLNIKVDFSTDNAQMQAFATALGAAADTVIAEFQSRLSTLLSSTNRPQTLRGLKQAASDAALASGLPGGMNLRIRVPGMAGAEAVSLNVATPQPLDTTGFLRHANASARLHSEYERELRRAARVGVPAGMLGTVQQQATTALAAYTKAIDPNTGAPLSASLATEHRLSAREAVATLRSLTAQYADTNAQQSADADLMSWRRQAASMSMAEAMQQVRNLGGVPSAEMFAYATPTSRADIQRSNYYRSRGVKHAGQTARQRRSGQSLSTDWDLFEQSVRRAGLPVEAYDDAYNAVLAALADPARQDASDAAKDAMRRAKAQFTADKADAAATPAGHQTAAQRRSDEAALTRARAIMQAPVHDLTRQFAIEDALKAQAATTAAMAGRTPAVRGAAGARRRLISQYERYANDLASGNILGSGIPTARLSAIQALIKDDTQSPKLKQLQEEAATELRDAARSVKRSASRDESAQGAGVVRALARYGMRGALSTVAGTGAAYISGGPEGLVSGINSGIGAAGNAAMSFGLTTGNLPVAAVGAVVSGISSLFGAGYERGAQKRRAGLGAAYVIEQQARAFSVEGNIASADLPVVAAAYATADSLAASASGLRRRQRNKYDPRGAQAAQAEWTAARLRADAAAVPRSDTSLDRFDLLRSVVSQLAQPRYGITTQQATAFSGGYLGSARFNPFTGLSGGALRDDLIAGAMSGLDPELVAQGRYLGMRGTISAQGGRRNQGGIAGYLDTMLERRGMASSTAFNLTGGAYGALGVAQSFGRYGAEANKFVNFALGLGEQSLARMGNSANLNALLGTATSLGKSGQSLESVQNYMQQSMSNAERSRDFFLAPVKDLGYMVRVAYGARGGGSLTDMARRAAGMTASQEAAAIRGLGGTVATAAFEQMGLDTTRGSLDFADRGMPTASAIRNNPWSYATAEAGKGRELMFAPSRAAARKLAAAAQKLDEAVADLTEGALALAEAGDDFTPSWMD